MQRHCNVQLKRYVIDDIVSISVELCGYSPDNFSYSTLIFLPALFSFSLKRYSASAWLLLMVDILKCLWQNVWPITKLLKLHSLRHYLFSPDVLSFFIPLSVTLSWVLVQVFKQNAFVILALVNTHYNAEYERTESRKILRAYMELKFIYFVAKILLFCICSTMPNALLCCRRWLLVMLVLVLAPFPLFYSVVWFVFSMNWHSSLLCSNCRSLACSYSIRSSCVCVTWWNFLSNISELCNFSLALMHPQSLWWLPAFILRH